MKVAFYRATRPGLSGIYNSLVRLYEGGPYSHCEIVFSNGDSASSSFMDHGVRFCGDAYGHPRINFNNGKWDLFDLPDELEQGAREWFKAHEGQAYDLRGNFRFLWPWFNRDSRNKWFCSEAVLAAVNVPEPWRFGVNATANLIKRLQ